MFIHPFIHSSSRSCYPLLSNPIHTSCGKRQLSQTFRPSRAPGAGWHVIRSHSLNSSSSLVCTHTTIRNHSSRTETSSHLQNTNCPSLLEIRSERLRSRSSPSPSWLMRVARSTGTSPPPSMAKWTFSAESAKLTPSHWKWPVVHSVSCC